MVRKLDRASIGPSHEAAPGFEEMLNEYYTLEAQLKSLTEEARNSENGLLEYAIAKETLSELGRSGEGEVLIPIGRDNFARAKLLDTRNVLVSIGSNIVVKKSVEDSLKMAESRMSSYEQSLQAMNTMITSIQQRLGELGPRIQALSKKAENKK